MLSKLTTVVVLSLAAAGISGTANFFNKIAVTAAGNPVFYTFLKNSLVAILLLAILVFTSRWREIKLLKKQDWFKLISIGLIGGSIPFVLFFTGLTLTSAVSASLIHKTLFIWVALLAIPFLGERLGKIQWAALGLLLLGNFFLGSWQQLEIGKGELMILAATLFWAVENVIAKKALQNVSSIILASARMILGSAVLLLVVGWQGNLHLVSTFNIEQWSWTILISVLLLGYVLCWYSALSRAPATLVASLLVPASLITSLLSLFFENRLFLPREIMSSFIIVLAIIFMVWSNRGIKPAVDHASAE